MAFTSGNDINILQGTDTAIVGAGLGDDVYIVSPVTMTAGQEITISDAQGINTLQLIGGLTIASSQVVSNALQLTLDNGAIINIESADTFNFNVGGNAITGDAGENQDFTTFVEETLGATVPAAGEGPVAGGEVVIGEEEVVTPEFSVETADVAEGETATFTVTLSEAVTEETTVDYTVSYAGDASADDIDLADLTGTLTFAAGETTATVEVPVVEDALSPEEGEGITVTLSNPTGGDTVLGDADAATANITDVPVTYTISQGAATVQEGDTVIYTITASVPLIEDTTFDFVVVPGDTAAANQGSNDTNLNDFNQGAFNPSPVTILAGASTATFSLITVDDGITELPEGYAIEAELDGEVVATYETTLLDGGSSDGGQTYTLQTTADDITGTSGNDTINGEDTTLTSFDQIDGGDGTDTMNLVFDVAYDFDADAAGAEVSNVENVNIMAAAVGVDGDISGWTGVKNVNVRLVGTDADVDMTTAASESVTVRGTQDITIQDATAPSIDILTTDTDNAEDDLVDITAASMTMLGLNVAEGTAVTFDTDSTALTVDLDGFNDQDGTADNADVTIVDASDGGAGIVEELTLNVMDDFGLDLDFAQATSLAVAGDSDLDLAITDLTVLESVTVSEAAGFDADLSGIASVDSFVSTSTGNIVATFAATALEITTGAGDDVITQAGALGATQEISTGAGDDKVVLGAALTAGADVDGGDDTDTISVVTTQVGTDASDVISNFEVVEVSNELAAGLDVDNFDGVQQVVLAAGTNAAGQTITNLDSGASVTLLQDGAGDTTITVTNAAANETDEINLEVSEAVGDDFFAFAVANVETINLTSTDTADDNDPGDIIHTVGLSDDHTTLNVDGDAGLVIDTAMTAVETINAADFDAGLEVDLTGNTNDATITIGDGDDTVTVADADNTISLGDGDAIVVAGDGDNTITGGESATGNAGGDVTVGHGNNTITLGDGGWTVTVGTGENAITTGAGDDIIEIGASVGLNTVDVGTGDDQVVLTAAPSAAGAYASVTGMGVDDIIDFSAVTTAVSVNGALGAKITLGQAAGFANYLDAAAAGDATGAAFIDWFQYQGNTYVVVDDSADATFQDGADSVIELVGLVDLSTSNVATDVLTIV